jgi:thiol-disulfide isomerase/thioredoxin
VTKNGGAAIGAVVMIVATAGLSACQGAATAQRQPLPPGPSTDALIARADLQPCPATDGAGAAAGGLPDVTLPCLGHGPAVDLAHLRGTPTVVDVYATWCGPCEKEAGFLSSAAAADKGTVSFLGIDTEDRADSALSQAPATDPPAHYPLLSDARGSVIRTYTPTGPPVTLFVTARGTVAHVTRGPYPSTAALQSDIHRYLGVAV